MTEDFFLNGIFVVVPLNPLFSVFSGFANPLNDTEPFRGFNRFRETLNLLPDKIQSIKHQKSGEP